MNKSTARRLVNQAKEAFGTLDKVLPQIIEGEAWTPLGYADVYEFWRAEFGDYRLGSQQIIMELAIAMVAAGKSDQEIVTAIPGAGPKVAKRARAASARGMSAEDAIAAGALEATATRNTDTSKRSGNTFVSVTLTDEQKEALAPLLEHFETTASAVAEKAFWAEVKRMRSRFMKQQAA